MSHKTMQAFSSTFGNHHYQPTINKAAVESNTVNGMLRPLDPNKGSILQPIVQLKSTLNNQFYINSFCEKENQDVADHTRKSTIYQQERRIIDLEEQNFKLRQALIGINTPSQDAIQTSSDMIEKQLKMRLESLTKQYQLKLEKQEELSRLEIWKLKEDIETLNYQLRNATSKQATSCSTQRVDDELTTEYQQHCPICADGEIVDRMCKMYNSLEDQHSNCLRYKKQVILKISCLEQQLQEAKEELHRTQKQQRVFTSKASELQDACKQLVRDKNELDSSNIRLIEENARYKLREDQLRIREEHIKLREQETTRSISRSQAMQDILHQQSLTTKNILPMKGSIIDRLHINTSTGEYRRPATGDGSVKKVNTTVSFDVGQRASLMSQYHRFQRKSGSKIMNSLQRRVSQKNTLSVAAILSSSSHHNLDTFRPKKLIQQYKYNI